MLLATQAGQSAISRVGFDRAHLMGLSGSAEVQGLQQALTNLATATGRPQINPGKIDGIVGTQTVMAVVAATDLLSEQLPTWAYLSLKAATAGASASSAVTAEAKKGIELLAAPLTVAANTAAVKFKTQPPATTASSSFFGPGWYKTPFGIALILGGAFVGYKLFFAKPATKSA